MTLRWRNQERVLKRLFTTNPIVFEQHASWFGQYESRDDDFLFIICDLANSSAPVGQIGLYRIDWESRSAEFGRLIIGEESALGRGLATAATRLVVELAFNAFKLRSISLEVFEDNAPAIAVYRRVGFEDAWRREGRLCMKLSIKRYTRPDHSVILGSYNRPSMVRKAIESVLGQTRPSFQLIITDDGSNELTIESIRSMIRGDSRCLLLHYDRLDDALERRDCANRAVQRINDAIPWVSGEIVHYLPDDDWYPHDRFEIFEGLFSTPDIMVGYGRLNLVDKDFTLVNSWYTPAIADPLNVLDHKQVAHRRSAFDPLPRWPDAKDWGSEGYFFRALKANWDFHGIDRIVAIHRWHNLNIQKTKESSTGRRE